MIPWGLSEAGCWQQAQELWSGSPPRCTLSCSLKDVHMGVKWHLRARPRTCCRWQSSLWLSRDHERARVLPRAAAWDAAGCDSLGSCPTGQVRETSARGFLGGWDVGGLCLVWTHIPDSQKESRFQHKAPGLYQMSRHRESPFTVREGWEAS